MFINLQFLFYLYSKYIIFFLKVKGGILKKIKFKIFPVVLFIIITVIVGKVSQNRFLSYQDIIVKQQMEHLLTISRSISRSMELYVDEKIKGLANLSNNLEDHIMESGRENLDKEVFKEFKAMHNSHNKEISNLIYIDVTKSLLISYPFDKKGHDFKVSGKGFSEDILFVKNNKKPYVGDPYIDLDGGFSFNIFEPVLDKGEIIGIVIEKIRIANMYELLVKPIKAGEYGYAMVKDHEGRILMHPVKEQVGYDVIASRKKRYPDLDYTDLEALLEKQKTGEAGSYIYYSYWWPQDKLEKVKKLNAFSPANVSKNFWIVAVVMSYDEISEPIINYLYSNIIIAVIIIVVFSCIIFLTMRMVKNKETHEMEINYLKELNKSSENLRKKEAELHYSRKLETIGTLTRGIAHEFNNILTPIMGYSEMILRTTDPDLDTYDYARSIYKSSRRAQEIIEQIQVFSGDKNMGIKYEVLSINKTVNEALKFSEATLPSNIKVIKDLKDNCGQVYANETQLHQVILNLCSNAYNAMKDEKSGILKISMECTDLHDDKIIREEPSGERPYIRLSFEDNGCGMNEETMNKIFDPFFTQKLSERSSGIGLAIVRGIVEKHGGTIKISSVENKGSRFDVYLPKARKKISGLKDDEENQALKGGENVLIVDDNTEIAEMLEKGLNELGYKTSKITDTTHVLKRIKYIKNNFQVVITDLSMPEISGIQISKKIKETHPDIKIILMTAHSEEPLEEYIHLKVIDDYLIKPTSAANVSKRIRTLIDHKN